MLISIRPNWITLSILLALAALAEWQFVSIPQVSRTFAPAQEEWGLPQISKNQPEKALEILTRTSPWGKLPKPGEQPLLNEWRFLGIITVGAERHVLIKLLNMEGQPEQQLKAGDTLPGGSKILKIKDDSLDLLVEGKKRNIEIYQREPQIL